MKKKKKNSVQDYLRRGYFGGQAQFESRTIDGIRYKVTEYNGIMKNIKYFPDYV